jgi:hypothetical protein
MTQTLDEPEDKRLFGLDLRVNRFRIINPVPDELLILTDKAKNSKTVWYGLGAIAFGGFFVYFLLNDLLVRGFEWNGNHSLYVFFAMFFITPGLVLIYTTYTKRAQWYFTSELLVKTNDFGIKKRYAKNRIKSVYVCEVINSTNGSYTGTDHWISLKFKNGRDTSIMLLDTAAGRNTFLGEMLRPGEISTSQEAHIIAKTIADYWQIPFSV